jgi:hypothetical protein
VDKLSPVQKRSHLWIMTGSSNPGTVRRNGAAGTTRRKWSLPGNQLPSNLMLNWSLVTDPSLGETSVAWVDVLPLLACKRNLGGRRSATLEASKCCAALSHVPGPDLFTLKTRVGVA